jgi:GDP/UDP-N,N'-diacetylbacillosamine 2-epimerase (hydrolysing)
MAQSRVKKVLALTGIRSEYDIIYPVLDALRRSEEFDLEVAVSGAHLSESHGMTVNKIEADGFKIADRIDCLPMTDRKVQRAKALGFLIQGLTQTVERVAPDILIVVGDREESMAAAIVANYMDVLLAHIGGGDTVFGNTDDPVRFAVSKLAHIHLATSAQSAANLVKIGEESFRVFDAGNPGLDNIRNTPPLTCQQISKELGWELHQGRYIVFLKHPLSSEKDDAYAQMKVALEGVELFCSRSGYQCIGLYPNSDPGSYEIVKAFTERSSLGSVRFFKTLPREIFVNVMRHARCLAGNSSMGILEAPFYKLPVVNVGRRQQGRVNAGNVVFVDYDPQLICDKLQAACTDSVLRAGVESLVNPYGDGMSGPRIRDILANVDLTDRKWYIKRSLC